eukprot:jgi/Mesvir1/16363/Mv18111-RA.1
MLSLTGQREGSMSSIVLFLLLGLNVLVGYNYVAGAAATAGESPTFTDYLKTMSDQPKPNSTEVQALFKDYLKATGDQPNPQGNEVQAYLKAMMHQPKPNGTKLQALFNDYLKAMSDKRKPNSTEVQALFKDYLKAMMGHPKPTDAEVQALVQEYLKAVGDQPNWNDTEVWALFKDYLQAIGYQPNPSVPQVDPLLTELHGMLAGLSVVGPKSSKNAKAGDTTPAYVGLLLQAGGRTVPGPGPSYIPDAEKHVVDESGEPADPETGKPKSTDPSMRGGRVKAGDSSEESHMQLRVTGVLDPDANAEATAQQLTESCGVVDVTVRGGGVYAWVPAGMVPCLETVEGILSWTPSLHKSNSVGRGAVISQGDSAMRADVARALYGVTGRGITVGIMADSFDCTGTNQTGAGQEAGELPMDVRILKEFQYSYGTDEGRAMAEIIHDVAPDARIIFHTSAFSVADAADGIRILANAGCDLIVSAFQYSNEPFYLDGWVAVAVNDVTDRGVVYVAAAGNMARNSYESVEHYQADMMSHRVDAGGPISDCIVMQWTWPWAEQGFVRWGFDMEYSIRVSTDRGAFYSSVNNTWSPRSDRDPLRMVCFDSYDGLLDITVEREFGGYPYGLKYVFFFSTKPLVGDHLGGSTIWGHRAAERAISVGAAHYKNTPVFDPSLPSAVLQPFSSRGGTQIFWRLWRYSEPPEIRQTPTVVGPDGGNGTTYFGGSGTFGGTSAAAPHVAGLVCLLLSGVRSLGQQLSPGNVRDLLKSSAQSMGDPEYDVDSGAGFVDAVDLFEPYHVSLFQPSGVLLVVKQGLNSSTTAGVLDDWVEGSDPCAAGWTGVTCTDGTVTGLSLSGLGLAGTLSPLLGTLRGLLVLELDGNSFSGTLPEELANLVDAQLIDLRGNQLSGVIPLAFNRLHQLVPKLPFTFTANSNLFAHDVSAQGCDGTSAILGPDAVFQLRAQKDAIWRLSLCDSSYDTVLLFTRRGNDSSAPNVIVCDDDSRLCGGGQQSGREVFLVANETYFVIAAGKAGSDAGTFTLEITEVPLPPTTVLDWERQALQQVKATLVPMMDPQAPAPLASWDGPNACNYEGVSCFHGRVTYVAIPDLGLAGTLDGLAQQPLLQLYNLESVDLSLNPGLHACTLGLLRSKITLASAGNNVGLCGDTTQLAVTVPSLPFVYVDSTSSGFGNNAPVQGCHGFTDSPVVIFEYVPNASEILSLSLCSKSTNPLDSHETDYFGSYIYVFQADDMDKGPLCAAYPGCSVTAPFRSLLSAGVKYYVIVTGLYYQFTGKFRLTIEADARVKEVHSTLMEIKTALQDVRSNLTDWKEDDLRYCIWQGVSCNPTEYEDIYVEYAGSPPVLDCPDQRLTSFTSFAAYLPEGLREEDLAFYDAAPNVISDDRVSTACSPSMQSPFFQGTTRVDCHAVNAEGDEDNCSFQVTVARNDPDYQGTAVVELPGIGPESFTPHVITFFTEELAAANSLNTTNFVRVDVEEVLAPRRPRTLLAALGVRITIVFSAGSLEAVSDVVNWFNNNGTIALAQIFARVLGVPVSTPTVSARINGGACCLPPSPDPGCLVDLGITSSALCEVLGNATQPHATLSAIWLGPDAQCSECAALWDAPGARSDPHFVTLAGTHFDWMGQGDRSFCIISDKAVHVNAHLFAGTDGRRKGTWMDQIAVLHGGDNVVVSTGAPAGFPGLHGSVSINGRGVLSVGSSSSTVVAKGLTVRCKRTRTWVTVEGILDLEVEVVRASTWEAGKGPGRDFLNFRVRGLNATEDVHGVLGQTFRPAAHGAAKAASKGMVEGADLKYMTSDLLAADCTFSRFSPTKVASL